ncbi:hypothetical protein [Janibacter melonis]|uniref:hypothetical protein n=1 Tax=Janibacter melonis TaxID=262209 RepID=UPI00209653C1|nr:hypothetical protein [Janibacter melonis]
MTGLPPVRRAVIAMSYLEDLPDEDIAEASTCPARRCARTAPAAWLPYVTC